jgi:DNA-binding CsgD family transcriptional regulator
MDPEVISQILARRSARTPLAELTPREREVLALMAEGRTNPAIARRMVITSKAVSKHIAGIFAKLGLPPSGDDHRRVLAVRGLPQLERLTGLAHGGSGLGRADTWGAFTYWRDGRERAGARPGVRRG